MKAIKWEKNDISDDNFVEIVLHFPEGPDIENVFEKTLGFKGTFYDVYFSTFDFDKGYHTIIFQMEVLLKKMMFQMENVYAQIKSKKLYDPEEPVSEIMKGLSAQIEGFNKDAKYDTFFSENRNHAFFTTINMEDLSIDEEFENRDKDDFLNPIEKS